MAIIDLFSKRQKKLRGEVPDVYSYKALPEALRTQIVHIWLDTLGNADQWFDGQVSQAYQFMVDTLCREHGLFFFFLASKYGKRVYLNVLVNCFFSE